MKNRFTLPKVLNPPSQKFQLAMQAGLRHFFEQYGKLSEQGMEDLTNKFNYKKVKKGERLLLQGQICRHIFFVSKGCLRLYYIANEVEITVWFSFENAFLMLSAIFS